jgi:uncharacterized repeat protein (TIGR01451 family)
MRRLTWLAPLAAAGVLCTGSAHALRIPGATYTGIHSGGGTVSFTVSDTGFEVTSFSFGLLPLGCGTYLTGDRAISAPITTDAFSYTAQSEGDVSVSGTFTGLQTATGTLSWSGSFCGGNHPTVTWDASTSSPPDADLSVTVNGSPDTVLPGDNVTYRATVSNAGPATALTPRLTATLPSGITFLSGSASNGIGPCRATAVVVTCDLQSLAAGRSTVVGVVVKTSQAGALRVSFDLTSASPDPASGNNTATAETAVRSPCIVPNVRGRRLAAARRSLAAAHCRAGKVTRKYSRTVRKGRVVSQDERPGARLAPGTTVDLVVSRGRRPRRV